MSTHDGVRDRVIVVALGMPGMGKSLLARQYAQAYQGKKIILDMNRQWEGGEWVPGAQNDPSLLDPWINRITNNGEGPPTKLYDRNGQRVDIHGRPIRVGPEGAMLILDDADNYLPTHNGASPWRCLWIKNRHLRLDVLITAHRTQGLPKELIAAARTLWLFAMNEPYALKYLAKIPALSNSGVDGFRLPQEKFKALRVDMLTGEVSERVVFQRKGAKR